MAENRSQREMIVREVLNTASLGGRSVSEKELSIAQDFLDGKISREEFEQRVDDMQINH